jgi:hypothetical protein
VAALYLRTLSRPPTKEESETWVKYLANPPALSDAPAPLPPQPGAKKPPAPVRPQGPVRPAQGGDPLARVNDKIPETRDPKVAAVEDLMWTLLNSSEFTLNH